MSTKKNIIAKKRITLGTKQFVPMFEQFLNESMEEEDEDMKNMEEIEEGGGDEDVEMESEEDMGDSGEGSGEEEEESPSEEEIEERIQEAYRRGLAKGKKLSRINEASKFIYSFAASSKKPDWIQVFKNKNHIGDLNLNFEGVSTFVDARVDWQPRMSNKLGADVSEGGTLLGLIQSDFDIQINVNTIKASSQKQLMPEIKDKVIAAGALNGKTSLPVATEIDMLKTILPIMNISVE